MNEEVAKQLAAFLGKLNDAAQAGGEFAIAQAPLVVQEKILYGRVTSTLGALLAIAAGIITCRVWVAHWRNVKAQSLTDTEPGLCVACLAAGTGSVVATVTLGQEALLVWLAPRLYILEWIAGLLK